MALFVTASIDFINRPYRVPNQNESTDFSSWLTTKESEVMESLLGWDLWDEFQTALEADYPADKWEELRDGAEYTYAGETWKYKGLNDLLVPVLYAYWLRDTFDKHTNIGIGINKKDDFESISPAERIARGYNVFARKVGNEEEYRNTLWGFLAAKYETNYTAWDPERDFKPPGRMNIFNI